MKPFARLMPEDLRRSPVWRCQSADGDVDAVVEEDGMLVFGTIEVEEA